MHNIFIKKAFLGFVGLLLVVSTIAYPGTAGKVDADGGTIIYLPVISNPGSGSSKPAPTNPTGNVFYVTTGGSSSGNGSMDRPWSLSHALSHPSAVKPGDTIFVRQGTYKGTYTAKIKGSSDKPIWVRAYPGERVTIDAANDGDKGLYIADSWYANYMGFEIRNSKLNRNTSDRPGGGDGAAIHSNYNSHHIKFINMIVHDVPAMGFAFWSANRDSEIYGSLVYYNGGNQYEHGIYTQNKDGYKRLVDNIIFNNSSHGIHAYGSGSAYLDGFHIEGNTVFGNGSIGYISGKGTYGKPQRNILVGGGRSAKNPVVTNNYTYYPGSEGTSLNLGYNAGSSNAKVTNNFLIGGKVVFGGTNSGVTMTGNTVYASSLEGLSQSKYSNNKWLSSRPTSGTNIFVRPNQYEAGRANITIYNWGKASNVFVSASDLASLGLTPGTRYELHNAQDFYGDVITGTYDGSGISVPMTGRKVAQPVDCNFKPDSTFPLFGVFVLIALP